MEPTRRTLLVATAAYVLGILAQNSYLFYVAPAALQIAGLPASSAPLVFASSAIATMLTTVPSGWLADRYPRRRVMRAGLALLALAYVPVLVTRTTASGVLASLISGTGLALLTVSFNSYVADLLAASEMSSTYGRAAALGVLGSAVGPFVGAALFALAPTQGAGLAWSALVFAAAGAIGALLTLALPHQPRIVPGPGPGPGPGARATLVAVSLFYVFVGASFGMTTPYFATLFLARADPPTWGVLLGAGTVATALALLAAGALGRTRPAGPLLLAGQAFAAVAAGVFLLPLGVPLLGLAYVARVFFSNAFSPLINTLLMSRVSAAARGVSQGWASAAWNAGWSVGALSGGWLYARLDVGLFALGGLVGLFGAAVGVARMRRLEKASVE